MAAAPRVPVRPSDRGNPEATVRPRPAALVPTAAALADGAVPGPRPAVPVPAAVAAGAVPDPHPPAPRAVGRCLARCNLDGAEEYKEQMKYKGVIISGGRIRAQRHIGAKMITVPCFSITEAAMAFDISVYFLAKLKSKQSKNKKKLI